MGSILLHHHLFKNCGSTFDAALKRYFGNSFTEFHPDSSDSGRVNPQVLYNYLKSNPDFQALSSHHFFGYEYASDLDIENKMHYTFMDCAFIRHPLTRLVSMYLYYRKIAFSNHPLSIAAHHLPLAGFLHDIISFHPNFAISPQVTMFGCDQYSIPSQENLVRALSRLKKMAVLGVVEEYKKSMVVAEYFLQPVFKGLQLHYDRPKNVSNYTLLPGYDGSLKSIKVIIGTELFDQLIHLNQFDIELWKAVKLELDRRASYVPDFITRYKEFSSRCDVQLVTKVLQPI